MAKAQKLLLENLTAAFKESSKRTRVWLYGTVLTSVLIIVVCWHNGPGNWMVLRIREAEADLKIVSVEGASQAVLDEVSGKDRILEVWGFKPTSASDAKERLKEIRDQLIRLEAEKRRIQIPVVNVHADANDVGLIGGLTLAVLMAIVFRCLSNELRTMVQVFATAAPLGKSEESYILIGAYQIMVAAPDLRENAPRLRMSRQLWESFSAYVLLVLPLFAQAFCVSWDWWTMHVGLNENLILTIVLFAISHVALFVVLYFTVRSAWLLVEIQAEWVEQCRQIQAGKRRTIALESIRRDDSRQQTG